VQQSSLSRNVWWTAKHLHGSHGQIVTWTVKVAFSIAAGTELLQAQTGVLIASFLTVGSVTRIANANVRQVATGHHG
jgi:hypothetical protein